MQAAYTNLSCNPAANHLGASTVSLLSSFRCPAFLHLLTFFRQMHTLCLSMPVLGGEELVALGEAGAPVAGVRKLIFKGRTLRRDFWDIWLLTVLRGLQELDMSEPKPLRSPAPVEDIVQCCAAIPTPLVIRGLRLADRAEQAALEAQLAGVPGCKVRLVEVNPRPPECEMQ